MGLDTALKAGIPLISVQAKDLVNIELHLKEFIPADRNLKLYKEGSKISAGAVYYTIGSPTNTLTTLYKELCGIATRHETSLVVVNPETPSDVYFNAGILPCTYEYLQKNLEDYLDEDDFRELYPALGGLTLKEVTDLFMITEATHGGLSVPLLVKNRLAYYAKTEGISIVDTELTSYVPDEVLHLIAQQEKEYFLGDHDYRLRPRGIIVHGAAGTGKTCGAKYIASQWGVPLFRLDPTIQSKWIGDSERNLADALKLIEQHSPAILLIDEAEKMLARGTDNPVAEKMLATLLWWMQEHREKVFAYMTCNDLSKLPAELQRPGRIDAVVEIPKINQDDAEELRKYIAESFEYKKKRTKKFKKGEYTGAEVFEQVKKDIKGFR